MRTAIFTGLSVALLMGQSVAWAKESDTSASVPEKCPKL